MLEDGDAGAHASFLCRQEIWTYPSYRHRPLGAGVAGDYRARLVAKARGSAVTEQHEAA